MKKMIPLFPLQLIVFPGEDLNLHIFEPRYKQLIADCRKEGLHFAVPPFINNRLMPIATEMELVEVVREYPNGEMDISTRALRQWEIEEYYTKAPGKLYAAGQCKPFVYEMDSDPVKAREINMLLEEVFSRIRIDKDLPDDPAVVELHTYVHKLGMNVQQMYEMYSSHKESERQRIFLRYLKQIMPRVTEMDEIRRKVQMNGHFKNVIPPM